MNDTPFPLVNGKLLVSVDEAAAYLSLGRSHLYEHIQAGRLKSVKIGRSRRIPTYALVEFVKTFEAESAGE